MKRCYELLPIALRSAPAKRHEHWSARMNAWIGIIPLLGLASGAIAEPVKLDGFIDGIENGCNLSKSLEDFRGELNARYSYEENVRRLETKVNLPPSIKLAVGPARAVNHASHTTIEVPLVGIYRGLPTRSISFDIGHSNGIGVTTILFDASAKSVENTIGADVARTMRTFETDPDVKYFGFSAKIVPREKGSALVCNTST